MVRYKDIKVGNVSGFVRVLTDEDVRGFINITGDDNLLHVDESFAAQCGFSGPIVHGMLAGSLFSTLIGKYCPGVGSLYVSQTLCFRHPISRGDKLVVRGTVTAKHDSVKLITLKTEIIRNTKVMISGEAKVKVLDKV